jgi:hypothetical protein
MGIPPESIEEAIDEIKMEVEARQRMGPMKSTNSQTRVKRTWE